AAIRSRRIAWVTVGACKPARRFYTTAGFGQLGIDDKLARSMASLYQAHAPTALQQQMIPELLRPRSHLLVRQTTGAGKTFAVLCTLLSLAIQEHRLLTTKLKHTSAEAFDVQALNTLVVVPNRELALQMGQWASELLEHAYPQMSRGKLVQWFVSGSEYEIAQRKYLKRHGAPAIVLGTPRALLELTSGRSSVMAATAPKMLQQLDRSQDSEAYVRQLIRVHKESKQRDEVTADGLRGLRRLVIDEVDQVLRVPGRNASDKERKLRLDKPRPGQVLVDRLLLETCGLARLNAEVQQARLLAWQTRAERDGEGLRRSTARGWSKDRDPALGAPPAAPKAQPKVEDPAVQQLQRAADLVGRQTLQVTALSATANSGARHWMQKHGWMSSRPRIIDSADEPTVPASVTHHCLVVEDHDTVRNFQARDDRAPDPSTEETEGGVWDTDVAQRSAEAQLSAMDLMADVAANTLAALRPTGSVVIFTRSDASTTQFARVLEEHGVMARDIMVHFDETLRQRVDQAVVEQVGSVTEPYRVYLATEESARGIDVTDAGLVLILDIPKNAASYAHMAGRTGRFGRAGTVVSVVPVGRRGWYESKMRGIFSLLQIKPLPAPFVE
ncbi:hypothetical protein H4R23_002775, partial [Coemansia sp. Cherry 401B]